MRMVVLAVFALAGCAGVGGVVDPKLVGEYQYWFIDVGEAIDLGADGTFVRRGIGICPISPTINGRWGVVEGRVVLRATNGEWLGRVVIDDALVAREYPLVFAARSVDGEVTLVDETKRDDRVFGWRGMEWTRHEPRTGAR